MMMEFEDKVVHTWKMDLHLLVHGFLDSVMPESLHSSDLRRTQL